MSICAQNNPIEVSNPFGKCVAFSFDYDEPMSYKVVDCAKVQNQSIEVTQDALVKREQKRLKRIAYQEKLKALGYDVEITGRQIKKQSVLTLAFYKKLKRTKSVEKE